jgi:hypothetical protein
MFERWVSDPAHPTLFRVDRQVAVYASAALPSTANVRADTLPLWVKSLGLRVEAHMHARQVAWVRRSDGGWLAAVLMPAASSNGKSRVTIPLWLDPRLITTDLSVVEPYEEIDSRDSRSH